MSDPGSHKIYDVFISYSRKDSEFATQLRDALERYIPPADLGLPQRHLRIFLDTSDFMGPDYGSAIETHLRNSDKLVVICSPNSRNSTFNELIGKRYVDHEIEYFCLTHGNPDKNIVLIFLVGVPNNEKGPEEEKAYPDSLYKFYQIPVGIDFRKFRTHKHGFFQKPTVNRGELEGPWYQLLAGIYGSHNKTPAEFQQKELKPERERVKRIRRIKTAVSLVLSGMLIFALYEWGNKEYEFHQKLSEQLTSKARGEQSKRIDRALLLSVEALNAMKPGTTQELPSSVFCCRASRP